MWADPANAGTGHRPGDHLLARARPGRCEVASRRKAQRGSSRTVVREGNGLGPGDTSHRRWLERVSTLRYSVVPRIFERGYPVVEVTRGKRSGVVANVSAIGGMGVLIVATRGEAGPREGPGKIPRGAQAV